MVVIALQTAPSPTAAAAKPRIHIVEVVDTSGCEGLKGGIATGGGKLLGGIIGYKANRGGEVIQAAATAGETAGAAIDKKARCRQAIHVQPGVGQ